MQEELKEEHVSQPRVKKRRDFLKIASAGSSFACRSLVVQRLDVDDHMSRARFGFTATKKIGNAVVRNRAKRLMRALVIECLKDLSGADYVLIARKSTVNTKYRHLKNDLHYALKKLHPVTFSE